MRALVTRPIEDAEPVAKRLLEAGIEPVLEPLLSIVFLPAPDLDLSDVQALLFTSSNGVRAFARVAKARDLPVFAVGDASARAARSEGYAEVESAGGNVDDLARLVAQKLNPGAGALLHVAGSVVAGDLAGALSSGGFEVRRAILYEARPASALSDNVVNLLRGNGIAMALFFSPRTAAAFVTLALKAGLAASCRNVVAMCLSPAVAKAVAGIEWRDVRIARRPELRALMDEIDAAVRAPP